MKKYFCIPLLLAGFISLKSFAQAQDSLLKVYNQQTIYRHGNKYLKGNEKFTYADLKNEFNSPSTRMMYQKSKKKLMISRIFNVASLAVVVVSVLARTNTIGSIQFAAGTGLLALAGAYFQSKSAKYSEGAIWERNREILFNTSH